MAEQATNEAVNPSPAAPQPSLPIGVLPTAIAVPSEPVFARPPVASRSTILSFMPRAVRANQLAAKATAVSPSPAFTQFRDRPIRPRTTAQSEATSDTMTNAIAEADRANMIDHDDENDGPTVTDDADMEIDAGISSMSRLHVDDPNTRTMPKKLTFGSMHRRHA